MFFSDSAVSKEVFLLCFSLSDLCPVCYNRPSATLPSFHKHTQQTHTVYLYGVGRYPPGKITWEDSLCRSILWEFWESILLDDIPLEITYNVHFRSENCICSCTVNLHNIKKKEKKERDSNKTNCISFMPYFPNLRASSQCLHMWSVVIHSFKFFKMNTTI